MAKKESHNLTFKDLTWQSIDTWRKHQEGRISSLSKDVEFLIQLAFESLKENGM